MAGFTTDHCVSTSARMAANLGFEVFLVEDATATFDRVSYSGRHYTAAEIHETTLTKPTPGICECRKRSRSHGKLEVLLDISC